MSDMDRRLLEVQRENREVDEAIKMSLRRQIAIHEDIEAMLRGTIERLRAENARLVAERDEALGLLARVEFVPQDEEYYPHACYICGEVSPNHKPGCEIAACLRARVAELEARDA